MMHDDLNLLEIMNGTIIAPAGCGKTHLIAETLRRNPTSKPVLVLTHTNAGVASLRSKLDRLKVSSSGYRLLTIDGWAIRLASSFPTRSGISADTLNLINAGRDYPLIRAAACKLLKEQHLNDILRASYSNLIVDEYQDCSVYQHAIIYYASQSLKTCVLGDPLQAIFNFGNDKLADWDKHVCQHFPIHTELNMPWRWINAGCESLGRWLLDVRSKLLLSHPIDLSLAPLEVQWVQLDGNNDHAKLLEASRVKSPVDDGGVLIIGESINPDSRYRIASGVQGAVTVEAVDLRDLINFARSFKLNSSSALSELAAFAQTLMTNVDKDILITRIQALIKGTIKKAPNSLEYSAIQFVHYPTFSNAIEFLVEINNQPGIRVYRSAILKACIDAMRLCHNNKNLTFVDAVMQIREQNRLLGRALPKRAVGSTLLLKGLEADVAVVLNANTLDASNLYVAMTRGCRRLIICSNSQILNPK
ncbi:TPA: AAA family ATPase [Legionella pneumophila]|nr:AAA family ATPase [Legionella pneumophila]